MAILQKFSPATIRNHLNATKLSALGFNASAAKLGSLYYQQKFHQTSVTKKIKILSNPVSQTSLIDKTQNETDLIC